MLYASMDGIDPRHLMDQWMKLGGEAGRWMSGRLTQSASRSGQTPEAAVERYPVVAGYLRERSLRGHSVIFTDTAVEFDFMNHLRAIVQAALAAGIVDILECINEIGHSSQKQFSWSEIGQFLQQIRSLGWTRALTAGAWLQADELVNGKYPPADYREANVCDTHGARGNEPAWDNANHLFAELRVIRNTYPWTSRLSGEPQRTDDNIMPASVFPYLLGVDGQGFNTWSTLHCSQARDCQMLTGSQLEDAKLFLRGGKILPRGRYHYENADNTGSWPDSPVGNAAFVEGPASNGDKTVWRAHSFRHHGGQWFLVMSGPDITRPGLVLQNGFVLDQKIDQVSQHVSVHTLKQG